MQVPFLSTIGVRERNAMEFSIEAPAKVNLCLAVEYPPADGYHQLESVFQQLTLHDTLHFEVVGIDDAIDDANCACTAAQTPVVLKCGVAGLATSDNLIFKAIDAMERAFCKPVVEQCDALRIVVDKQIPAGGGLGGGSSDAAAAIRAYLRLCGIDEADERAHAVARSLGADVAFFLYGGAALMDGRGDTLVSKLPEFALPLVLMGEGQGISTAQIYRDFDARPPKAPDARALAQAMEEFPALPTYEQKAQLAQLCSNNLQPAAFEALPRLKARVERANASSEVLQALVTGSGATSYAICPDLGAAMRFEQEIAPWCDWTAIC